MMILKLKKLVIREEDMITVPITLTKLELERFE